MITDKQVETLDKVVYNPQTYTTEVGGNLEVGANLEVNGDLQIYGDTIADRDLKVGGYLYVDGAAHITDLTIPDDAEKLLIDADVEITSDLNVSGEIISGMPTDISVFGLPELTTGDPQITSYSKEQLIDMVLKYTHNGFIYEYGDIARLTYLDKDAVYNDKKIIFVIQSTSFITSDVESLGMTELLNLGWGIIAFYSGENEITLKYVAL